jgi:hypothetical protein
MNPALVRNGEATKNSNKNNSNMEPDRSARARFTRTGIRASRQAADRVDIF